MTRAHEIARCVRACTTDAQYQELVANIEAALATKMTAGGFVSGARVAAQLVAYHQALDMAMGLLARAGGFLPSKSPMWPAVESGAALMAELGIDGRVARFPMRWMRLKPMLLMPPELTDGRGLMLYGRHVADSGREGGFKRGDHWWAIALWNVWWQRGPWVNDGPCWCFSLNGRPLRYGFANGEGPLEPTHFCELEPP